MANVLPTGVYSHITVGAADIERAARFYDPVLATLGLTRVKTFKIAIAYAPQGFHGIEPPFWVLRPHDRKPQQPGNGNMVAFNARTRADVDAFHDAAIAAGGSDEGVPGLRPHYHANFYGAYVRDLDGNKLGVVCHDKDG